MLFFKDKKIFIFDKRNKKIPTVVFVVCLFLSCFAFGSIAYGATNENSWYESDVQEICDYDEVYNDGDLQITTKVETNISPVNGDVTTSELINVRNLNDRATINFNSVKLHKYEGFESANLANWNIKSSTGTVLFEGNESTDYVPSLFLYPGDFLSFNVSTTLTGNDALNLRDTTPFEFVYEYELQEPHYDYKVCIWGIEEDRVLDSHHNSGLSFGPAIGKTRDCLEVDGHESHGEGKHCIHEDSWEEIVKNCNEGNWWIYSDCMEYGCTKAIPINVNSALFNSTAKSVNTECSAWSSYVKSSYTAINAWHNNTDPECANYTHSRLRATLNGYDEDGSNFTPSSYAYSGINDCLTRDNCALSCFPKILQENIIPKYFRAPTFWDPKDVTFEIAEHEDICDKLWFPSTEEIWGIKDIQESVVQWYDDQYSKTKLMDVTHTKNKSKIICYGESLMGTDAWTCQPHRVWNYMTFVMDCSGQIICQTNAALDPFFCLGSKEIGLDYYTLEDLNKASYRVEKFSDTSPYYDEFLDYIKNDDIWWSNSNGYFKSKGYNYTSAVTDKDVKNCNQDYINNFKDSSGQLASNSNRFVFLRVVGLNDDFYEYAYNRYLSRGITFQCVHALPCAYAFDSSSGRRWANSTIKTTLNQDVYDTFCDEFKDFITQRRTFTNYNRTSTWQVSLSDDKLYLPSYSEMWAVDKDTQAAPYSWYDNGRDESGYIIFDPESTTYGQMECSVKCWNWIHKISGSNSNNKLKYLAYCNDGKLPSNSSYAGCWLRSSDCANKNNYFCIDQNGHINSKQKYDSKLSVAPCFCLGVED